jgi:hypothetical protein
VSTSCGRSAPEPMPESSSATSPSFASPFFASVFTSAMPGCRLVAAITRAASTISAAAAAIQRRFTMPWAQRVQLREALSSVRRWGQSSFSPHECRITGSSVSATSTDTNGITIPP